MELASQGGRFGWGTIFKLNTDGSGFTVLHSFAGLDGANPMPSLSLVGTSLYGTTAQGGGWGTNGSVFKLNVDGTGFASLHGFTDPDGGFPFSPLNILGGALYGIATPPNTLSETGTVFKVNTDGTGFTNLYRFTAVEGTPSGNLVVCGNSFNAISLMGGSWGYGSVFKLNVDGTGFTNLHSFMPLQPITPPPPEVKVRRSSTNLVVTWPTDPVGSVGYSWGVEFTTNLISPVWVNATPAATLDGTENVAIYPISGPRQFYRLRGSLQSPFCRVNSDCPCNVRCLIPPRALVGACNTATGPPCGGEVW